MAMTEERLQTSEGRVLTITGPVVEVEFPSDQMPEATLAVVPGAGHTVHLERGPPRDRQQHPQCGRATAGEERTPGAPRASLSGILRSPDADDEAPVQVAQEKGSAVSGSCAVLLMLVSSARVTIVDARRAAYVA